MLSCQLYRSQTIHKIVLLPEYIFLVTMFTASCTPKQNDDLVLPVIQKSNYTQNGFASRTDLPSYDVYCFECTQIKWWSCLANYPNKRGKKLSARVSFSKICCPTLEIIFLCLRTFSRPLFSYHDSQVRYQSMQIGVIRSENLQRTTLLNGINPQPTVTNIIIVKYRHLRKNSKLQ